MTIVKSDGTKLTKSQLLALTTSVPQPPVVKFTEDIFEISPFPGAKDFDDATKSKRSLLYKAGTEVPQGVIDAMYAQSAATVDTITPATGLAAGNTPVTIAGSGFAGTRGVTFGGTAATNVKVVSDSKITCNAPAHAAGAVNVVVQDASGDVTKTNGYTYS